MTVEELIGIFRDRADDWAVPQRWSDVTLIRYLNEAEVEACRRSRLLVDSSSLGLSIVAAANDWLFELPAGTIQVRRAHFASTCYPLQMVSVRDMDESFPGWETHIAATPDRYFLDYQTNYLAVYPKVKTADTLKLTVSREPLEAMTDVTDSPEIVNRYQYGLVDWMLYQAYSMTDAELYDPKLAQVHLMRFEAEYGPKMPALDEHFMLTHYPMNGYEGTY